MKIGGPNIKAYLYITLGTVLIAFEVYFFEIPNGFSTGGVSGLSVVLGKLTAVSPSDWIVLLNIALLAVGFVFLGRSCGVRTVYCTLLYSAIMKLFEIFFPERVPFTDEALAELVIVVLLSSVGAALIFRCDATSGGTDIAAMIIKKYSSVDVGKALLLVDSLVAISSFFVFGVKTGIFSVLGLFARAFMVDSVIESLDSCKCFMIVTNCPELISGYIIGTLDRSATVISAKGAYSGGDKAVIHTVCRRYEAMRFQRAIKKIDPEAFTIITTSSEIIGSGFRQV